MTAETDKPEQVPSEPLTQLPNQPPNQPLERPPVPPLMHPLKLKPRFVPRLWGGDALPAFHGASDSETLLEEGATPIGESWLLGDDNEVVGGPLNGRTVKDLAAEYGAELLGTANTERYGNKLALLAKFLDAKLDLSVQVHPDDDYALTHERETGHLGKAEAWYVLAAEAGASVLWGFTKDTTAEEVRQAIENGSLESLLNRLPVGAGDVIVNPAGMVHAVGAGVMLFEIQQASDLTYRLYDYDRRDAQGRPRELHVEKSLDVAQLLRSDPSRMPGRVNRDSAAAPQQERPNTWRRLVEVPEFVMDVAELGGDASEGSLNDSTAAASLELLVLTRGEVTVCGTGPMGTGESTRPDSYPQENAAGDADKNCVSMRRSDAVLLPAALGSYTIWGRGEILRCAVVKEA